MLGGWAGGLILEGGDYQERYFTRSCREIIIAPVARDPM